MAELSAVFVSIDIYSSTLDKLIQKTDEAVKYEHVPSRQAIFRFPLAPPPMTSDVQFDSATPPLKEMTICFVSTLTPMTN